MKNTLTIFFIFLGGIALGQKVQVDTFNLILSDPYMGEQVEDLHFPIIRTGNKQIDAQINTDLIIRFTDTETPTESLDKILDNWGGDQLVSLGFEVTYNQKGILSFHVSSMGCTSNCYGSTDYFNYSIVTGKYLEITDIIDLTEEFKSIVNQDRTTQYTQQKSELKENMTNSEEEFDQETYEFALAEFESCEGEVLFESFILYPDTLQIINECYFPSVIRAFQPAFVLKYSKSVIKNILKIEL